MWFLWLFRCYCAAFALSRWRLWTRPSASPRNVRASLTSCVWQSTSGKPQVKSRPPCSYQVRSLTQFYSVGLLQSRIRMNKKWFFYKHTFKALLQIFLTVSIASQFKKLCKRRSGGPTKVFFRWHGVFQGPSTLPPYVGGRDKRAKTSFSMGAFR